MSLPHVGLHTIRGHEIRPHDFDHMIRSAADPTLHSQVRFLLLRPCFTWQCLEPFIFFFQRVSSSIDDTSFNFWYSDLLRTSRLNSSKPSVSDKIPSRSWQGIRRGQGCQSICHRVSAAFPSNRYVSLLYLAVDSANGNSANSPRKLLQSMLCSGKGSVAH